MTVPVPPLTSREQAILLDLGRVRLLSGSQLERLHFSGCLTPVTRASARRRTLGGLVKRHLVGTLPRSVGGERAGSSGLIYQLTAAGARRLRDLGLADANARRWAVGWPFVRHTLDVADLYVQLREREQCGDVELRQFDAEPASWWRTSTRLLKPDAYVFVTSGGWELHHWVEVDRATESRPTIRRKLSVYLEFARGGGAGPQQLIPGVLVTTPTPARRQALREIVESLPRPAEQLIAVELLDDAVAVLCRPPPGLDPSEQQT